MFKTFENLCLCKLQNQVRYKCGFRLNLISPLKSIKLSQIERVRYEVVAASRSINHILHFARRFFLGKIYLFSLSEQCHNAAQVHGENWLITAFGWFHFSSRNIVDLPLPCSVLQNETKKILHSLTWAQVSSGIEYGNNIMSNTRAYLLEFWVNTWNFCAIASCNCNIPSISLLLPETHPISAATIQTVSLN